jgi:hypothetical protein
MRATLNSVFFPLAALCLAASMAKADEHTKDSLDTVKKNLAANVIGQFKSSQQWAELSSQACGVFSKR